MKADLHVHSYHSGYARNWGWLHARDCYSSPDAVYRVAKSRGMDLVCLTDHDRIDGCLEFLDRHPDAPDFIMGEEIECQFPDAPGLRVHLGAIGMTEAAHHEVRRLRSNALDVAAYLRQQNIFFGVNHLFMFFRDQMPIETYVRQALRLAPGLETHNGAMLAAHNTFVAEIAAAFRTSGHAIAATGGSDAHTLRWVGTAYTDAPGNSREEFLESLRNGRTRTGGSHGGYGHLFAEVYGAIGNHWRSLLGLERSDMDTRARLFAGVCSALLLPFQFVPGILVLTMKRDEQRRVEQCRRAWTDRAEPELLAAWPPAL